MSSRHLTLLLLAALLGCQAPATAFKQPRNGSAGGTSPRPSPQSLGQVRPVDPSRLGPRSTLNADLVSNQGGRLTGRVVLPAKLLSDRGAGLISDQGGAIIGNNSGGLFGKTKFYVLANGAEATPGAAGAGEPVASATVVLVDAAGNWLPDGEGKPYMTTTDAEGTYAFASSPAGLNALVLVLGVPEAAGKPVALLPAIKAGNTASARTVDVDVYSTLTMAYIASRFVQGNQAILNKLPADVEAETRRKVAQAVGKTAVESLVPTEVVARIEGLRTADSGLDAQVRYVERLLVAGLSNMGEGLPATEVTLASPHRLAVRPNGEVYMVENWAGRIRRIAPDGTLHTVAGGQAFGGPARLQGQGLGDGGPASGAVFNDPRTLALDPAGNVYLCDTGHHRIRRIDAASGRITTVAGNRPIPTQTFSFLPLDAVPAPTPGALAVETAITSPHAIAIDAQGRCVFASREGTFRIEAGGTLTPLLHAGKVLTPIKLASNPEGDVYAHYGADGFGRLAGDGFTPAAEIPARVFKTDWHLAAGPGGVLYMHGDGGLHRFKDGAWSQLMTLGAIGRTTGLAATAEHVWLSADTAGQVWRFTPANQTLTRVGGVVYDPTRGVRGDELSLNRPGAIALDTRGRLLVGDGLNGVIWRRDGDGLYRRLAGNGAPPDGVLPETRGPAVDQAIGISTTLLPQADGSLVFCAGNQNQYGLFIVDAGGQLAPLPLPGGVKPLQVAPDGAGGYYVSDTTLLPVPTTRLVRVTGDQAIEIVPRRTMAAFYGLLPRPDGSLYYTDVLAGVVYRRAADGTISVVAGKPDALPGFSGDGAAATAALLRWPMSLIMDAPGHLYIADTHNHRVRRVDARTGVITTLAGEGGSYFTGTGVDDGLQEPAALALDASGTLYIADAGHSQIKQIPADKLPR